MTEGSNLPMVPDNTDDFTRALIEAGYITPAMAGKDINRIKVKGSNFEYNDEIIASYNAKTKEPALIVQLLGAPIQYQGMWFDKDGLLANAVNRPGIAGKFCRSYFDDPQQARKYAEDGTSCETCEVHPWKREDQLPAEALAQDGASKCSWRGEIEFRILEKSAEGVISSEDETIYTMSLPTTAMIEFVGSNSRNSNQLAGSVSEYNTMVRLAALARQKWGDEGISQGHTALALGGVIAEVRALPASNKDRNFNYNVVSFNPIDILEMVEQPALTTTSEPEPETEPEPKAASAKPKAARKSKAPDAATDNDPVPF